MSWDQMLQRIELPDPSMHLCLIDVAAEGSIGFFFVVSDFGSSRKSGSARRSSGSGSGTGSGSGRKSSSKGSASKECAFPPPSVPC